MRAYFYSKYDIVWALYSIHENYANDTYWQMRELIEHELIQTQMTQKPMPRAEVGMRVRCANKASAECIMRGRGIGQNPRKNCKKARHLWVARTPQKQ